MLFSEFSTINQKKNGKNFPGRIYFNIIRRDNQSLFIKGIIADISEEHDAKEALKVTSIFETEQRVDKFQVIQENLAYKFKNRKDPAYVPGKYDLNISIESTAETRGTAEPGSDTPD